VIRKTFQQVLFRTRKINYFFFFSFLILYIFDNTNLEGGKGKRKKKIFRGSCEIREYLTLRSVLSLNNPQNTEMKFCENI